MSSGSSSYYATLGIQRSAELPDVQAAYELKRAALLNAGRDPVRDTDFQRVQYAYDVLSDSQRRELYDSLLVETAEPTLTLSVQTSARRIRILDTAQIVYLLVEARPHGMADQTPLPLNISLVIDRSTSMRGARLDQVKLAVQMVLDKLAPSDVLSVISFSDRAEIVLPSGYARDHLAERDQVNRMVASGGTEIYQGLAAGFQQLQQVDTTQYTNHLILLTDGHTYGDSEQCLALAEQALVADISITAFGIGEAWNDTFLDALVAPANGRSDYINQPSEIITHLENRINNLGAVFARNVRLQTKWPGRVMFKSGFKLSPFAQTLTDNGQTIALGDIEGRAPLVFLLELTVASQPIATRMKLPLTISAEMPGQTGEQTISQSIELLIVDNAPVADPSSTLLQAARLMNLHQLNEKALQEAESGQLQKAATRMRHLSTRFLESGDTTLAAQARNESQRLSRMDDLSPEGRKQLKYGTRSLIGQTMPLEWHDSL